MPNVAKPRLLVSGFGPFPGAPENPTAALVRELSGEPPERFGASALRAVVLKTEYRRSWATLRRLSSSFAPDIVLHFGLNASATAIHVERLGRNAVDRAKPDASGYAPKSAKLARNGPDAIASTFCAESIAAALRGAEFPVALSDDAGDYVCNATLYRSLVAAPASRRVGFVHMPPIGAGNLTETELLEAARIVLRAAVLA